MGKGALLLNRSKGRVIPEDWIDSNSCHRRHVIHPLNYLLEEIYRDYWGIPESGKVRSRKRREVPAWQQREPFQRRDIRR